MLLEREELLESLAARLENAASAEGSMVLIAGEAGSGKTSVVRALVETLDDSTLVMQGACDPLTTPRPLSPLHDFAADPDSGLHGLDFDRDPIEIFNAVLDRLRHTTRPVVMTIEDIHWADEATLDFLRFIGRRLADSKAMLVCTYRDDEVGPDHPLKPALGQLSRSNRPIASSSHHCRSPRSHISPPTGTSSPGSSCDRPMATPSSSPKFWPGGRDSPRRSKRPCSPGWLSWTGGRAGLWRGYRSLRVRSRSTLPPPSWAAGWMTSMPPWPPVYSSATVTACGFVTSWHDRPLSNHCPRRGDLVCTSACLASWRRSKTRIWPGSLTTRSGPPDLSSSSNMPHSPATKRPDGDHGGRPLPSTGRP